MFHLHNIAGYVNYLSHLSHLSIFLAILASGHILPIPESVTLILLGYLAAIGKGKIISLLLIAFLATIFTDLVMYAISLSGSKLALALEKRINIDWIERYRTKEEKRLFFLVFASHFVPGWRLANPVIAGITRMPWRKFTLYTLISSLVYAPLFVLAGFFFNRNILPLIAAVESIRYLLFYILIVVAVLLIGAFFEKDNKGYNKPYAEK
jgi:membrane protein DedA with SNARE-associated domain